MTTDIASLGFSVDSAPLAKGSSELDKLATAAKKAEDAAVGMGSRTQDAAKKAEAAAAASAGATRKLADSYGSLDILARRAVAALGAVAAAMTTGAIAGLADTWSDLNARVGLAVRNMEAAGTVMDRLFDIAKRTYSPLEQTAEAFIRNNTALRDLGKSANDTLDYTEALNLALVVSGAKGDRARQVQDALAKSMASGALRGQELNTIIEVGGRVTEALAEELGVSASQLRTLGEQGKITGDVLYTALVRRLEIFREETERMPTTIGDAFVQVRNAVLRLVGVFDQNNKLSVTLAENIKYVADNLDVVAKAAGIAAVSLAAAFSGTLIAAAGRLAVIIGTNLVGATLALGAALRTNPLVVFGTAIVGVTTFLFAFRDEINKSEGVLQIFGNAADWVVEKMYRLSDVFGAVMTELTTARPNDDAFKALAAQRLELQKTLDMFEEARDSAIAGGTDSSAIERQISSLEGEIADVMEEYRRLHEIREQGELSFTDRVLREAEKRREARAWEQGTTVTKDFGLDTPGVRSPELPDLKAYDRRTLAIQRQVEGMKIEAETYGMTEAAAARYRVQKELENEAIRAGIDLSAAQRVEILALADTVSQAAAQSTGLKLVEDMRTVVEAEREHYALRLQMLQEFSASGTATVEQTAALWSRIQEEHLVGTQQIYTETAARAAGTLDALASAMDGEGKKQFQQAKALSIASAVLKGYESAVSSYAAGTKLGGPSLGAAYMAMSIATTAAQIAKIKSTSYSGGSSSASGRAGSVGSVSSGASSGGTSGSTTGSQAAQSKPTTFINVTGSRFSKEELRLLIEDINSAIRDGAGKFETA